MLQFGHSWFTIVNKSVSKLGTPTSTAADASTKKAEDLQSRCLLAGFHLESRGEYKGGKLSTQLLRLNFRLETSADIAKYRLPCMTFLTSCASASSQK